MAESLSQIIVSEEFTRLLIEFVIPFVIFFTILFFVFKKTRIFGDSRAIYILIALGLTLMIYVYNPENVFQFLVSYLFKIGVAGSVIALIGASSFVFLAIIRWTYRNIGLTQAERMQRLERDIARLYKKFYNTRDVSKRTAILEEIKRKEKELSRIRVQAKIPI